ncbi:hypothetical protein Tco_1439000 [Tanacetum coccineum]
MSKLLYTRFTKLILDYLLSLNKSIPRKSDSKLYSSQDGHTITKLLNTTNGDYKFGMEVPDAMISDAIKKKAGERGKGFMCYGDQVANVPNKLKKDVVPRKTRSLTIAEEAVVGELANSINIQEPRSQRCRRNQFTIDSQTDEAISDMYNELESLRQKKQLVTGEGSSVAHNKYYSSSDTDSDATLHSSSSDESKESTNETDDDNLHGDDDDDASHPVYTDAQTTLVVHNPEGNPELTSKENSLSYNNSPTKLTSSQNKEADAKGEQNIRKFNFKKAFVQKFKEYDQKLEAHTNFNVSEALEKGVQAKVLTEIKKLLPTHTLMPFKLWLMPRLNTTMLEDFKKYAEERFVRDTFQQRAIQKELEEYVGGRPKIEIPRTFVRPLDNHPLLGRLLETQKSVDYMTIYLIINSVGIN